MGIADLFRSTGDHLKWLRSKTPGALATGEPAEQPHHELPEIHVSADFSRRIVRIDIGGVCDFTLDRKTAFNFAKQVEGAADALGPEPAAKDDGVEVKVAEDGSDGE